jgi:hypothetical protein
MSEFGQTMNLEHEMVPAGAGQELNVGGAAVQCAALPAGATHAFVFVKGNAVRVTFDGTAPVSAGAGGIVAANMRLLLPRVTVEAAKWIESVGASAAVLRFEPVTPIG